MKKLIPVFLCLFFLCGCSSSYLPPQFDFSAACEAENFSGEIICSSDSPIEVKTVTPEEISGMTAKAGNSVVVVSFAGTEKNSVDFPAIRDLSCSRAALMLDALRRAELNLSAMEDGKVAYTAVTEMGDLTLVTDLQGNILALRQESSGFTLRLDHQNTLQTQP